MKTFDLISKINNSVESIDTLDSLEDIIDLPDCVAQGLELDEYRWYSTAVNVYECENGFVGVYGVYQIFSEETDPSEIGIQCVARLYKQVPSVTYKPVFNDNIYKVITYPEVQFLMEKEGFREHSYLINDTKGLDEFGSSAYFVDTEWLKKVNVYPN